MPAATSRYPVSRPGASATRSSACAACGSRSPGRTCSGCSCGRCARGRARAAQGHGADGERARRVRGLCALFEDVLGELKAAGVAAARPPLGMMVEVPAAAHVAAFPADFLSIGSNDLIQYVMAASAGRACGRQPLRPARSPAVLELIRRVVSISGGAGQGGQPVRRDGSGSGARGSAARRGLRRLSVAPAAIGRVKAAIAAWRPEVC